MPALINGLDVDVLAEVIETAVRHEALLAVGCGRGQGFLYGRPQPVAHWHKACAIAA